MVIYQRLLHVGWQQNGNDRLQVGTICNQNEHFMAVIDVCEKLSNGCSVDEAKEALATIAVQLTNDDKENGHLHMALLSINKLKETLVPLMLPLSLESFFATTRGSARSL